jgi:hypothetical protein
MQLTQLTTTQFAVLTYMLNNVVMESDQPLTKVFEGSNPTESEEELKTGFDELYQLAKQESRIRTSRETN